MKSEPDMLKSNMSWHVLATSRDARTDNDFRFSVLLRAISGTWCWRPFGRLRNRLARAREAVLLVACALAVLLVYLVMVEVSVRMLRTPRGQVFVMRRMRAAMWKTRRVSLQR